MALLFLFYYCIKSGGINVIIKENRFQRREMKNIKEELAKIYDGSRQQLFAYALSITGCCDAAEDVIHKVFAKLLGNNIAPQNLKAYVFRCVRNAAYDSLKNHKNITEISEEYIFDTSSDPRRAASEIEFRKKTAAALLRLPDDERETVVAHIYSDLTFREIAEMRGSPIGTVASWYQRGIARLREMMEE